jgi:hypothetical protein
MAFPSEKNSLLVVSGTYDNEFNFYIYEEGSNAFGDSILTLSFATGITLLNASFYP